MKDQLYYEAVDLLKQLISIPSLSRTEEEAASFLENYLNSLQLSPHRKGNNIWLITPYYDSTRPTILLNSHIDTVKPVPGWESDPFEAIERDGMLIGLGSNDAGAPLVSLLQAYRFLTQSEQPCNFIFLASCEEEVSGKNGVELALSELPKIDFGVVGEPTNMDLAIAEKGLMVLDAVVYGKSGHAAREEGVNAIYEALPAIEWFRDKRFEKVSPLLGEVKMSLTMIQAGSQHNVVPGECRMVIDVRSNECYRNEDLFNEIATECGCEVTARSFRLNSSSVSPEHPFVNRAVAMGAKTFGSPTLSDQALMSFPTVKIGPGSSSRSHTANEFVYLSEIREAIEMYICLLDKLAFNTSGSNLTIKRKC